MGNKLFKNYGVDIAKEVDKAISPGLFPGTLTRQTPGSRDAGDYAGGNAPTTSTFTFRGCLADTAREGREDAEGGDSGGSVMILIMGDSLSPATTPAQQDELLLLGKRYRVTGKIKSDPDSASHLCACTEL